MKVMDYQASLTVHYSADNHDILVAAMQALRDYAKELADDVKGMNITLESITMDVCEERAEVED